MEKFLEILGVVLVVAIIGFPFGWFVMLLWNWLMPMIFGLTSINYWEAYGLYALCRLLLKSTNTSSKK